GQPDYILECVVLFLEVDKHRDRKLRNQVIWQNYLRRCQSVRVLVRKRMKQNTFDDAVNRGACANTQGERQDGRDCKSGTLSQHPQGITNIIPMTSHPAAPKPQSLVYSPPRIEASSFWSKIQPVRVPI